MRPHRIVLAACAVFCSIFPAQLRAAGQVTQLYSFAGAPTDAAAAFGAPVPAGDGIFLGTSYQGGSATCSGGILPGCGTVYSLKLTDKAGVWSVSEEVLLNFQGGDDGYWPQGSLVAGPGGVFYGTTSQGGTNGVGTVFSLVKTAGTWTKTILYNQFSRPTGYLLLGSDGALYGTAQGGQYGNGEVFQLSPPSTPGGAWTESTIFSFPNAYPDASASPTALIGDPETGFYGTTEYGGTGSCTIFGGNGTQRVPSGCGTVYSLVQSSPGLWTQTVLYNFKGRPDDGQNAGSLVMGANGVLYGTLRDGGRGPGKYCPLSGCGLVYALSPPVPGTAGDWTETVLKEFTLPNEGEANPDGLVYLSPTRLLVTTVPRDGDAFSTVLELGESAQDKWAVQWVIDVGHGESNPFLVPYRDKELGVTAYDGDHGDGTVFLLTP